MACVRAMIIGPTVSVTRGPAWKLTDEFTHIASNTWSPLSPLLRIFFPFVSSCRRRSGSRELSIRMAPPFTLKSSCHAPHVGLYLFEKSSLSQSLYPYLLDRRRTWESHDFACRQQLDDVPRDSRSLHPTRTNKRRHTAIHTHNPLMAMALDGVLFCKWLLSGDG